MPRDTLSEVQTYAGRWSPTRFVSKPFVAHEIDDKRAVVKLVPVDPKTEENLATLKEILSQKIGKPATLTQVVAWAAEVTRTKFDPVKRAERSRKISFRKSEAAPKPGRQPVRASIKHPVVLRDGMRCVHVSADGRRCEQKRWLQLHHVVEVSKGGLNTVDNLRMLCKAHHDLVHSEPGPPRAKNG